MINSLMKHLLRGKRSSPERGFTLLELSLAMTFLSFIVLFLVMVIMQMTNMYNKAISLAQMDAASRQIMTDLNDNVRFSATKFTTGSNISYQTSSGGSASTPQTNGGLRVCFGGVSYIINLSNGSSPSSANGSGFSVERVGGDFNNHICTAPAPTPPANKTQIVLGSGVLVQKFSVSTVGSAGNLVKISMQLSTSGANAPATSGDLAGKCGTNSFCAFSDVSYTIFLRGVK